MGVTRMDLINREDLRNDLTESVVFTALITEARNCVDRTKNCAICHYKEHEGERDFCIEIMIRDLADALEQLKRERDAAVADVEHLLRAVGYDWTNYGERFCKYCIHDGEKFGECQQDCNSGAEKWEWRGVQDEQTD